MSLFRLLLEVWRFGAWMEFITIGSSVLALPGHSSAQTELCSWLINFFHCGAQNSLPFGQQTEPGPTVFNQCLLPLPAFMDWSRHQPAVLSGTWCLPGKPLHSFLHSGCRKAFRACLSVAQGALFLSREKMGKLEASPLNLGPNSISQFGFWKALVVWVPWRNHWEEWIVSRWPPWIWGFT